MTAPKSIIAAQIRDRLPFWGDGVEHDKDGHTLKMVVGREVEPTEYVRKDLFEKLAYALRLIADKDNGPPTIEDARFYAEKILKEMGE